jgi:hypothetical protein
MRALLLGIMLVPAAASAPHAQRAAVVQHCMPPREMQAILADQKLVAPTTAVVTARHAVQEADVLRADLCRDPEGLIYVIMALRKDGRVVQVTIDAPSGKLKSVR